MPSYRVRTHIYAWQRLSAPTPKKAAARYKKLHKVRVKDYDVIEVQSPDYSIRYYYADNLEKKTWPPRKLMQELHNEEV